MESSILGILYPNTIIKQKLPVTVIGYSERGNQKN